MQGVTAPGILQDSWRLIYALLVNNFAVKAC